jgi:conjugative relaxase-like TrwC/TraI family protein
VLSFVMRSDWTYLERHGDAREHSESGEHGAAQRSPQAEALSYYTAGVERDEPPGRWWGQGAASLGLSGEASSAVMAVLYGKLEDPRSGEPLGTRPRRFATVEERLARLLAREPGPVTPERQAALQLQAHKAQREARHYADLTFSPPKSWSVLHAALEYAGRADDAEQIWAAWLTGVRTGMAYLMREAGYSRAGYHGAAVAGRTSGQWLAAPDWVISMWRHHVSRDGDPQLHVHVATANRVRCSDGVWRSLDSRAISQALPAAGALAERAAEEDLVRRLGVQVARRPDGLAREIVGISAEVRDLFSSRRRAITAEVAERLNEYQAKHGRPATAYIRRLIAEHATLKTRNPKPLEPPTRGERLDGWQQAVTERLGSSLERVLEAVGFGGRPEPPSRVFDAARLIERAVAELEQRQAVWQRHDLVAALIRQLPDGLVHADARQLRRQVDSLAERALGGRFGVVSLVPPPAVEPPAELRRADGRSLYEPHRPERYSTLRQLSREEQLLAVAGAVGGPRLAPDVVERLVGASRLAGDQAAVARAVLGSGKRLEVLVGPAGTGKSYTLGSLVGMWREGFGRETFGLAVAQNAVRVLRDEGIEHGANVSQFLAGHERLASGRAHPEDRQRFGLQPGQLVVIDEASMLSTVDLARLVDIAAAAGAKVLLTGDPQQLDAVDVGGGMRLLTERLEPLRLEEVRRFREPWERQASLGLRDGQAAALWEYDQRGRFVGGPADEMRQAAFDGFLGDLLGGRRSLLVVDSNEAAAELASEVRQTLIRLGRVAADGVALRNGTFAGRGDLIQTRRNEYRLLDAASGQPYDVVNREIWRVAARQADGGLVVERELGRDDRGQACWGPRRVLSAEYVAEHVELAYASTIHAAQGRTVDTAHLLVGPRLSRAALYVGLTRGVLRNVAYVVTKPDEHRLDRLTALLGRPDGERAALDVQAQEFEAVSHLGHLGPIWSDQVAALAADRHRTVLAEALGAARATALERDDASGALYRLLRTAELEGYDSTALLRRAIASRELDSADSLGQVLTYRLQRQLDRQPMPSTATGGFRPRSYRERTPGRADAIGRYVAGLAAVMDRRTEHLAGEVEAARPAWAAGLGPVPAEPLARLDWLHRAGAVASYREQFGHDDPAAPLGPRPGRGDAERRAAWQQAAAALNLTDTERALAGATDGELANRLAAYERQQAWLPPNVDDRLRATHLAQREAQSRAARLAAEVAAGQAEEQRQRQAAALAERMAARAVRLEEIAAARAAAIASIADIEAQARDAQAELDRRHPPAEPVRDEPPAPAAVEPRAVVIDDDRQLSDDLARARAALARLRELTAVAEPERPVRSVEEREREGEGVARGE